MAENYEGPQIRKLRKHNIVLEKELWTVLQHLAPEGLYHAQFIGANLPSTSNSYVLSPA